MNARDRRRCARLLTTPPGLRCFRHPARAVVWWCPDDPEDRDREARGHALDAVVCTRSRSDGMMLWAALHRRAAVMLRRPRSIDAHDCAASLQA